MRYEDPEYVHSSTNVTVNYKSYYCTRTEVRLLPTGMILGHLLGIFGRATDLVRTRMNAYY